jgi:hypothetical protein
MGCDLCANRRCPSNPNFAPLGRTLFFLILVQQGLRDKHQLSRAIRSAALPPDLASEPPRSPRTSKTSLRQATPNVSRSGSTGACSLRVSTALRQHCPSSALPFVCTVWICTDRFGLGRWSASPTLHHCRSALCATFTNCRSILAAQCTGDRDSHQPTRARTTTPAITPIIQPR